MQAPAEAVGPGWKGGSPSVTPVLGGSVRLPAPGEPAVGKEGGLLGSREHPGWLGPSTGEAAAASLSVHSARSVIRAWSGFRAS